MAMKAVAGMANPLLEACVVRTGTRLAFRHRGAMVDPIRRQLLFDFERWAGLIRRRPAPSLYSAAPAGVALPRGVQDRFLAAVQAEEAGEKQRAIAALRGDSGDRSGVRGGLHQPGNHSLPPAPVMAAPRSSTAAPRRPIPYVLAYFDLGNVLDELQRLDESIAAYRQALRWRPAMPTPTTTWRWPTSARGSAPPALRHWQAY
jgi:tetratricopeptide (TPR) repeat protein